MQISRFFALAVLLSLAVPLRASGSGFPALSLQHLLVDKDCEAVPEFLGDWTGKGDVSGEWTTQGLKNQVYRLVSKDSDTETGRKAAFDICVAHIGRQLFFDATFQLLNPDGQQRALKQDENLFWIPLHLSGRLEIAPIPIVGRFLAARPVQVRAPPIHLARNDDGEYILTASSRELKEFAAHFASDAGAFSCIEDFARPHDDASC